MNPATTGTIAAIGAAVVPLVVSLLKQEKWSASLKQLIAGATSLVVAVVGVALTTRNWSALNLVELGTLAFSGATAVYGVYFKGSALDAKLTTIGRKKVAPVAPVAK